MVEELLASQKFRCQVLCGTKEWFERSKTVNLSGIAEIELVEQFELEKISQLITPHEVLAVFSQREIIAPVFEKKLSLILDGIRDPGNMGTIIRTADWFAIENIFCSQDSVDCYNPKVVQATMGSLARVNIVYTGLYDFIHSNDSVRVYAATLSGKNLSAIGKLAEGMVVIGNESTGIRDNILQLVKYDISIPRFGRAESLNAAVACGIILASIR